jgi:hypothetical protein
VKSIGPFGDYACIYFDSTEIEDTFATPLFDYLGFGEDSSRDANSGIHTAVIKGDNWRNEGETNVAGSQMGVRTGRNVLQFRT